MAGPDPLKDRIIEQRVRNRLIEYFQLASSYAAQAEYEHAAPPFVYVPHEVIEQWGDWVHHLDVVLDTSQVYTDEERGVLREFQRVWESAADAVGGDYPSLAAVQEIPAWETMRREAESALSVFSRRGRLPEE
ncbi:hypothetical protein [Arthrobacter sp. NEB 688]|uniref:hypothetical protein n=1 Tax=Arthrobacter sp. NEB 688 TaxID=904039 RepID=UPI001563A51C|nr:hypothetical protein [Arthrobacter sp. NEB 688]QKE85100.1 hypothetical protein HL663_14930 [Arthrobacter sp. NEB 688]